jgi:MFS family permease
MAEGAVPVHGVATAVPLNPASRRRVLAAVVACICIYGITFGLTQPLLSLILEGRGVGASLIGLNAATASLGTLLASPLVPWLVRRAGARRLLLLCIALEALLLLSLKAFDSLTAWFLIRFLLGASAAGLFVVSETWINEVTSDHSRGRIVGFYTSAIAASFALGPLVIPITGIEGWAPFVIGALLVALAAIPLLFAGRVLPALEGSPSFHVLTFLLVAPVLAAAVLLAALKDSALMSLLPVYGVRSGMAEGAAATMLAVFGLGAVVSQMPLGMLADRVSRERLLALCAAGGGLGAVALPFLVGAGSPFWIMLFLWGGLYAGIYTLALILVGQRFRGAELATANAAFGLFWGIGSLSGPLLGGAAMAAWNPHGLAALLVATPLLFLLLMGWRSRCR